jgi:hypothetical protein
MRRSDSVALVFAVQVACLVLLGVCSIDQHEKAVSRIALERALVRGYGLTDLCLFSEVRYTRHPSQADFSAAFQDFPASLDRFPSGSLLVPPAHISGKQIP